MTGRPDDGGRRTGPALEAMYQLVHWLIPALDSRPPAGVNTLLAVLRQLRAGYPERPGRFPQSVILCGVRDVRDYRIRSSAENAIVAGGSAFNVRAKSLRLGDFTPHEVESLLAQHTRETGQAFTGEARTVPRCRHRVSAMTHRSSRRDGDHGFQYHRADRE